MSGALFFHSFREINSDEFCLVSNLDRLAAKQVHLSKPSKSSVILQVQEEGRFLQKDEEDIIESVRQDVKIIHKPKSHRSSEDGPFGDNRSVQALQETFG